MIELANFNENKDSKAIIPILEEKVEDKKTTEIGVLRYSRVTLVLILILITIGFLCYIFYESVKPIKGCEYDDYNYVLENNTIDITGRMWGYSASNANGFGWHRCICPVENVKTIAELYDLVKNETHNYHYTNFKVNIGNFKISDEITPILRRKPYCSSFNY